MFEVISNNSTTVYVKYYNQFLQCKENELSIEVYNKQSLCKKMSY